MPKTSNFKVWLFPLATKRCNHSQPTACYKCFNWAREAGNVFPPKRVHGCNTSSVRRMRHWAPELCPLGSSESDINRWAVLGNLPSTWADSTSKWQGSVCLSALCQLAHKWQNKKGWLGWEGASLALLVWKGMGNTLRFSLTTAGRFPFTQQP